MKCLMMIDVKQSPKMLIQLALRVCLILYDTVILQVIMRTHPKPWLNAAVPSPDPGPCTRPTMLMT